MGLATSADSESQAKRLKLNDCVACFGLFNFTDEIVSKVKASPELVQYEVKKFLSSYSLPVSLDLAQLQIWLSLIEKFPNTFDTGETNVGKFYDSK